MPTLGSYRIDSELILVFNSLSTLHLKPGHHRKGWDLNGNVERDCSVNINIRKSNLLKAVLRSCHRQVPDILWVDLLYLHEAAWHDLQQLLRHGCLEVRFLMCAFKSLKSALKALSVNWQVLFVQVFFNAQMWSGQNWASQTASCRRRLLHSKQVLPRLVLEVVWGEFNSSELSLRCSWTGPKL